MALKLNVIRLYRPLSRRSNAKDFNHIRTYYEQRPIGAALPDLEEEVSNLFRKKATLVCQAARVGPGFQSVESFVEPGGQSVG
jgi:hypothetical protein